MSSLNASTGGGAWPAGSNASSARADRGPGPTSLDSIEAAPVADVGPLRIAFAGGGSGGHVYPALAVAREAQARSGGRPCEVLFLVTREGLEHGVIERHGLPLVEIPAARLSLTHIFTAIPQMLSGISRAREALRQFHPHVVYGTGGFVSFPAVMAAWLEGIPSVLHEPNTVPGRANLLLARFASAVVTHFEVTTSHLPASARCLNLGTPLRYSYDPSRRARGPTRTLLVLGGSQGARSLNRSLRRLYPRLAAMPHLKVIHVTGTRDHGEMTEGLEMRSGPDGKPGPTSTQFPSIDVVPYTESMDEILYRTDVAVCRSGALTVSELVEFQIPALYVPHPIAVGNHQFENARVLLESGASDILEEKDLTDAVLFQKIEQLLDPTTLEKRRDALARHRRPGATRRVLDALEGLVRGGRTADE